MTDLSPPLLLRLRDVELTTSQRLVGAKAHGLARLEKIGLPVPAGFIVTSTLSRTILEHGRFPDSLLNRLGDELKNLEEERLRQLNSNAVSLGFAVRSGAAESQPGLMLTLLARRRKRIVDSIQQVVTSWAAPKAQAYRRHWCIDSQCPTAVLVQWMVPCKFAGVAHSSNPVGLDSDESLLVEVVAGLGDQLVSGAVTPRQYRFSRDASEPAESVSGDQSIAPARLFEIVQLLKRVEEEFDSAVEIEWGCTDDEVFLLQVRVDHREAQAKAQAAELTRAKSLASTRRGLVQHDFDESIRSPTPMTWSVLQSFMSGSGGYGQLYRNLGYRPTKIVSEQGFVELLGGRVYADPKRMSQMLGDGFPAWAVRGHSRPPVVGDGNRLDLSELDPWLLFKLPHVALTTWRAKRTVRKLRKTSADTFEHETLPRFLQSVEAHRQTKLDELSDDAVLEQFERRCRLTLDEFAPLAMLPGAVAGIVLAQLRSRLQALLGEPQADHWVGRIAGANTGPFDHDLVSALKSFASNGVSMSDLQHQFAQRGSNEWEFAVARWGEEPDEFERLVEKIGAAHSAEDAVANGGSKSPEVVMTDLRNTLAAEGCSSLGDECIAEARDLMQLLPYRERARHFIMQGFVLIRQALLELASRWDLGSGIFFLSREELTQGPNAKWPQLIESRRIDWRAAKTLRLPDCLTVVSLAELNQRTEFEGYTESEAVLNGEPLSAGFAQAKVQLFDGDVTNVPSGCLLVCATITPDLVPLLFDAAGVVVETGGMLSHGAAIVRQLGIPAMVCPNARSRLSQWDTATLDANNGEIRVAGFVRSRRTGEG